MNERIEKKYLPYLYITPALLVVLFVFIYPIVDVVLRSFTGFLGSTARTGFVGTLNYRLLFSDKLFWISFKNSMLLLLAVPIMTILSIFISAVLFEKIRFASAYQSVVFFPFILAIPVVGVVFSYILQLKGVLNQIFIAAGLNIFALDWLGNGNIAIWSVMFIIVWKQTGLGVVVFLSRLCSIDMSLYESASIDGANWWQKLFKVSIPQLASVMEFFVVISILNTLSWIFDYIYVITGGGPANMTFVFDFYIYRKAFSSSNMFIASSASVLLLLMATIVISFESLLRNKVEDIQ
jgi:ABC-type sugar transport system permease subunit